MKLSSKIIIGFIMTNVLYIILQAVIFFSVRPVETQAELLADYVMPAFELAADTRFNMAEQRSTIRAFVADPTNDRKIFDIFLASNRKVEDNISKLGAILSAPEAAFLATPEVSAAFRTIADNFRTYTEVAMLTPERQDAGLAQRVKQFQVYQAVGQIAPAVLLHKVLVELVADAFPENCL